jgi:hypothetical protein
MRQVCCASSLAREGRYSQRSCQWASESNPIKIGGFGRSRKAARSRSKLALHLYSARRWAGPSTSSLWKSRFQTREIVKAILVRMKERLASEYRFQRGNQVSTSLGLCNQPTSTRCFRRLRQTSGIVHGEDHHWNFFVHPGNFPSGFQSAHNWHGDIHDYDVWMQLTRQTDGFAPIFGLTADLPFGATCQNVSHALPYHLMVICNHNPHQRESSV